MAAHMLPALCDCPDGPADCQAPYCPYFHYTVELIGRRWSGDILRALLYGMHRYRELRARIPEISDRMLTERLKELESAGLIQRNVIPAIPVRVEYRLTPRGEAVRPILDSIGTWAAHCWTDEQVER